MSWYVLALGSLQIVEQYPCIYGLCCDVIAQTLSLLWIKVSVKRQNVNV